MPASLAVLAVLALAVLLIAALYSNLGLGGGFMYVPALILIASLDKASAVACSLGLVLAGSLAALYQHSRASNVDFRLAAYLSLGTCAGSVLGTAFNLSIGETLFRYLFLAITISICAWMASDLYRAKRPDVDDDAKMCVRYIAPAVAMAVFAGFLSGAFGIGGGAIMVPVLIYFLCRHTKLAVGTSAATIAPTALTGILTYMIGGGGQLDSEAWLYVAILAPIAFAGALLGTHLGIGRLTAWQIKAAFLSLTVLVAITLTLTIVM